MSEQTPGPYPAISVIFEGGRADLELDSVLQTNALRQGRVLPHERSTRSRLCRSHNRRKASHPPGPGRIPNGPGGAHLLPGAGAGELVPRKDLGDKLTEYFRRLFQADGDASAERSVQLFQRAVLDGKAALAVQPRGDIETQRALQLLNEAGPVELRAADLESQALEHAATAKETPVLTWMGKVLASPGAPDTTGAPKLPDYPSRKQP
jgi:hypothetical protein